MTYSEPPPSRDQRQADLAEAAAVQRYLAMRALWGQCWSRLPAAARPRHPRGKHRAG